MNLEQVKAIEATGKEIERYDLAAGDIVLTEAATLTNSAAGPCGGMNYRSAFSKITSFECGCAMIGLPFGVPGEQTRQGLFLPVCEADYRYRVDQYDPAAHHSDLYSPL